MVTKEILADIPLFEGLPEDAVTSIATLCRQESFPSGTVICAVGHLADRMYLLLDGTVGLLVHPTSLPKPMTIMVLKMPGQPFGWSALVGRGHYSAQVQVATDVRAISIDGQELLDCLEEHPAAGFEIMKRVVEIVSGRLRTMRTLMLETVCD